MEAIQMCTQEVRQAIQERRARTENIIFYSLAALIILFVSVIFGILIFTYDPQIPCRGLLCWP